MGGKEDVANPETIESVLSAETMSIMKTHESREIKTVDEELSRLQFESSEEQFVKLNICRKPFITNNNSMNGG